MKKLLTGILVLFTVLCFSNAAKAYDFESLYDKYQAVYIPSANFWTTGSMSEDRIVLTKKITEGSGSYSEYYYGNGKLAMALKSNFEFIKDGKLIGVDNAGLKYYEIVYNSKDKIFEEKLLNKESLEKIFPNAQIVKISQFENNQITIKKQFFKEKTILLVNDTDKYFHKYSFTPQVANSDVKGLININKMGKIRFSLYEDKSNMLTINVKHI